MLLTRWCLVLALLLLGIVSGCADQEHPQVNEQEVGFRFGMRGDTLGVEDFVAVTADQEVIATARAELLLPVPERIHHIHGVIRRGNAGRNLHWGWYFVPGKWALVEESIEVCDATPSAIQATLESWGDTLRVFCPLVSYVKAEIP